MFLMTFFQLKKLEFISLIQKFMICQLKNIKYKKKVAFLSANTWDVSGGGNYGYSSIWVNRNNNIFDNLDYKPKNEVKNLKQLLDIV